jgi:hypothetical protein
LSTQAISSAVFFRVYVGAAPRTDAERASRAKAITRRIEQIDATLQGARLRSETAPDVSEVADHLPTRFTCGVLFGAPASPKIAAELVDFLLWTAAARRHRP